MQVLVLASTHPGSGQITVLVNLASGLAGQGKRVIIGQLGPSERLYNWAGIDTGSRSPLQSDFGIGDLAAHIVVSRLGMDFLTLAAGEGDQSPIDLIQGYLEEMDYDYLLLNPTSASGCRQIALSNAKILLCTDLQGENEVKAIQDLQDQLQDRGVQDGIALIVSNRIETKEWDHNSRQLMILGDYFGYEKLADPIPT